MRNLTDAYRHTRSRHELRNNTPGVYGVPRRGSGLSVRLRNRGVFFFAAHILARVVRPSDAMLRSDAFAWARRELFPALADPRNLPALTLHVRRGDVAACHGKNALSFAGSAAEGSSASERRCYSNARFLFEVDRMVKRYGYRSVYVATDDDHFVSMLERTRAAGRQGKGKPSSLPWGGSTRYQHLFARSKGGHPPPLWLWNERRHVRPNYAADTSSVGHNLDHGRLDPWLEVESVLIDAEAAARTHGYVGQFRSSLGRLMYHLMFAKGGSCARPFVSLDERMCNDFMRRRYSDVDGRAYVC